MREIAVFGGTAHPALAAGICADLGVRCAASQAIARRRGKKIATTAIARKLLARAWHLLADTNDAPAPHHQAMHTSARADRDHKPEGSPSPGELAKAHEPAMPRSMT